MPWPNRLARSRTSRPARQVQHPARAVRPASGDGPARRSVAHAVRHDRPPDAVDRGRGGRAAPDLPAGHRRPLPHAVAGRADAPLLVRRAADRQPPGAPRRLDCQAFRRRGGAGGEDQLRRLRPPAADPLVGRRPPAPASATSPYGRPSEAAASRRRRGTRSLPVARRLGARAVSERRLPVVVPLLRGVPLRRRPHRRGAVALVRRLPLPADDRRPRAAPWSAADAEHNYRACAARIVVPVDELDGELARLAALPAPAVSAVP